MTSPTSQSKESYKNFTSTDPKKTHTHRPVTKQSIVSLLNPITQEGEKYNGFKGGNVGYGMPRGSGGARRAGGGAGQLLILYETACDTYLIDSVLPPPTSCCTQFANIAQSDPQAMCALVSGNFGSICNEPIDKARVIALPQFCNVKNPCNCKCLAESFRPMQGTAAGSAN